MEAKLAERGTMTEWNDGRLDDLSKRVDNGFARVDKRIDRIEEKVDAGFHAADKKMDDGFRELSGQFASLQRTLIQIGVVMAAALIGLIATQL
jgi:iron uptake system EfeUOB component EfeO/EfeM